MGDKQDMSTNLNDADAMSDEERMRLQKAMEKADTEQDKDAM